METILRAENGINLRAFYRRDNSTGVPRGEDSVLIPGTRQNANTITEWSQSCKSNLLMRNYIFGFILAVTTISCKSQNMVAEVPRQTEVIYLPEYYSEIGIVFDKDYAVGIEMNNLQYRYTPSEEDIIKMEKIFKNQYNSVQKTGLDIKAQYNDWVRQYVGLVDKEGSKNIIVQLIDNTSPRKINKLLGKGWQNTFIVMPSDSFYEVSTIFRINIDTKEMTTDL